MAKSAAILCSALIVMTGCQANQHSRCTLSHCYAAPVLCEEQAAYESEAFSESGSIEDFVETALARNPRILEAQFNIERLRHRIPQALSLPDPTVATTTHLAPVQTAAGEQAFVLGVNQKYVSYDRRATKASIVNSEIAAAESNLRATELEIAVRVRSVCQKLLLIQASLLITEEDARTLQRIAEMIEEQFVVKKSVTQQDVLNVQMEQAAIANRLTDLRQNETSKKARLARLLHFDASSDLTVTDKLKVEDQRFDVDGLIALATQIRPELKSQIARIQQAQKKIRLAELENRPDVTIGLNWIATSNRGISPVANGEDAVLLGVGFNLPIFQDRIRAGILEARASQRVNESKLDSLRDEIAEEVYVLVDKLESLKQMLGLMQNEIIPKASRTLELSIAEYATGSADYVQLIENWRNVLRFRLSEAGFQSQYNQAFVSLVRAVGQLDLTVEDSAAIEPSSSEWSSRAVRRAAASDRLP